MALTIEEHDHHNHQCDCNLPSEPSFINVCLNKLKGDLFNFPKNVDSMAAFVRTISQHEGVSLCQTKVDELANKFLNHNFYLHN